MHTKYGSLGEDPLKGVKLVMKVGVKLTEAEPGLYRRGKRSSRPSAVKVISNNQVYISCLNIHLHHFGQTG